MFEWLIVPPGQTQAYFSTFFTWIAAFIVVMYALEQVFKRHLPVLAEDWYEIRITAVMGAACFMLMLVLVYIASSKVDSIYQCARWAGTGELCEQKHGSLVCQLSAYSNLSSYYESFNISEIDAKNLSELCKFECPNECPATNHQANPAKS